MEFSGEVTVPVENQTLVTYRALNDWQVLRNYNGIFNCPAIFDGNNDAIEKAKEYVRTNPRNPIPDIDFIKLTNNCSLFKVRKGYTKNPVSQEELEFPLAFSILFHKNLEHVEYLLRTIYRQQNWYCLHLDADAPQVALTLMHFMLKLNSSFFSKVFTVITVISHINADTTEIS